MYRGDESIGRNHYLPYGMGFYGGNRDRYSGYWTSEGSDQTPTQHPTIMFMGNITVEVVLKQVACWTTTKG